MKSNQRIFLQGTTKLENKYRPLLLKVIKDFRKKFIEDYQTQGELYAKGILHTAVINEPLSNIIKALYRDAGLFGAKLTASELKAVAGRKAGAFGRNEAWIRAVSDYLRFHLLRFVANITETMRDDILNILQKAVEEGISINETVARLKNTGLMEARARVIARTEIVRAANVGHSVAAKETPYEISKKWSAAKDHRTRHSHKLINGKTVDEDETFRVAIYEGKEFVGYDNMLYPGDATAHPSNTINCRCRMLVEPKRDANGNLIMREQTTARIITMPQVPTFEPAQIAAQLKANLQFLVE